MPFDRVRIRHTYPATRSSSTAFFAILVAAAWIWIGRPRFPQKRDCNSKSEVKQPFCQLTMKSALVIWSRFVSSDLMISLKQRPISFFETRETAQISENHFMLGLTCSYGCLPLKVRGTPSLRQAMYKQAAA